MSTSVNVLYLSYDGLTDPLGQSQILPYLCGLSDEYAISIISFEKRERFIEEKEKIEKICWENNIQWIPLRYHKKPPVISTMFDLWKLRRKASIVHKKYNFRIVHCRSYITSLIGLWMKKKYDIKFVFDMRGFWADERVEGGLWNLKNPLFKLIYNFFKRKENNFLSKSDYIISLTNNAKDEMLSWNVPMAPIEVIPTCVDMELFNPELIQQEEREVLRRELGIGDDDFVLLYLGSLGTWYLIREMLDFFVELKSIKSNARFLFVTHDHLNLANFDCKDAVIIKQAPRNQVPLFISICDASIMFIKPSFSKKASSATKMAEIMAMNVPIITNKGWGDVENIIKEPKLLLDQFGHKEYRNTIVNLLDTYKVNVCSYSSEWSAFSLNVGIQAYRKVYIDVIRNSRENS